MTATIHRCADCKHKDGDHERTSGSRCSMGACPCSLSQERVVSNNPPEEIPTFPGFDHAAGKWSRSGR